MITRGLATWLEQDPRVAWVRWPGSAATLTTIVPRATSRWIGRGVLLRYVGGRDAGRAFIESLELCSRLANIGDVRTLVIYRASTTHQQHSDEQLDAAGVSPDLVRLSVGLEDANDIIWDLDQALTIVEKQ